MPGSPRSRDLSHLLPRRGIAVRPPSADLDGAFGLIVLLLVSLIGLVAWLGPDIAADWRTRSGGTVAALDASIKAGGCRTWLGAFRFCKVTVAAEGDSGVRTFWYAFLGWPGEQRMEVRRAQADPSRVTTTVGLDNLYSRAITLLLLAATILSGVGIAASMLRKSLAARRAFTDLSGQPLMPVIVEIERNNRLPPRRRLWVYLYDDGGKRERALAEWPTTRRPLFTSPDEKWALALTGLQGGTPMLLDAGLTSLDLTQAEKADFGAAFRATFGHQWGEKTPV
jgi:hypothetical protein